MHPLALFRSFASAQDDKKGISVIQTTEGRKDLGDIHFLLRYVPEIFHFVQNDKAVVGTLRAAFD